jgi:starch synthase
VPLFAFASRLTEQKMADQVLAVAPAVAERFGQLAFVAEGERRFERGFAELSQRLPGRIAGTIGYDEAAAHRLLGGPTFCWRQPASSPAG